MATITLGGQEMTIESLKNEMREVMGDAIMIESVDVNPQFRGKRERVSCNDLLKRREAVEFKQSLVNERKQYKLRKAEMAETIASFREYRLTHHQYDTPIEELMSTIRNSTTGDQLDDMDDRLYRNQLAFIKGISE